MNIIKKLCPNFGSRENYKPEIIVVHISTDTLASMTSWFNTPKSQASAHYGVGKDGTILQYVEEKDKAWANGRVNNPSFKLYKPNINPNLYTISIENEGKDLSLAPNLQIETLCELIKDISQRWNIPLDREHIIGHFQIDNKNRNNCPSPDHSIIDKIVAKLQTPSDKQNIKEQIIKLLEQL